MLFKIFHRFTGAVLFEREADSLKLCVTAAVEAGADLAGADLGRESIARIEMGLAIARELGWPMGEPAQMQAA